MVKNYVTEKEIKEFQKFIIRNPKLRKNFLEIVGRDSFPRFETELSKFGILYPNEMFLAVSINCKKGYLLKGLSEEQFEELIGKDSILHKIPPFVYKKEDSRPVFLCNSQEEDFMTPFRDYSDNREFAPLTGILNFLYMDNIRILRNRRGRIDDLTKKEKGEWYYEEKKKELDSKKKVLSRTKVTNILLPSKKNFSLEELTYLFNEAIYS